MMVGVGVTMRGCIGWRIGVYMYVLGMSMF